MSNTTWIIAGDLAIKPKSPPVVKLCNNNLEINDDVTIRNATKIEFVNKIKVDTLEIDDCHKDDEKMIVRLLENIDSIRCLVLDDCDVFKHVLPPVEELKIDCWSFNADAIPKSVKRVIITRSDYYDYETEVKKLKARGVEVIIE